MAEKKKEPNVLELGEHETRTVTRIDKNDPTKIVREISIYRTIRPEDIPLIRAHLNKQADAKSLSKTGSTDTTATGFAGLPEKEVSSFIAGAPLTDRQRDCAHMKWDYELSDTEISKRLGIARATVQEYLEAANKKIQQSQIGAKRERKIRRPSFDE